MSVQHPAVSFHSHSHRCVGQKLCQYKTHELSFDVNPDKISIPLHLQSKYDSKISHYECATLTYASYIPDRKPCYLPLIVVLTVCLATPHAYPI